MCIFKDIVIIGASGLVGNEFIKLLIKNKNILDNFTIKLISNNYINSYCSILNLQYYSMSSIDYSINSIFINCANNEQAKIIKLNMNSNSLLIDNSSEFRMDTNTPLIIPEINFDHIQKYNSQVISNPNCSTIIMSMLINPFIKNNYLIKRIVVSTYQSASGAGKEGLEELETQTKQYVNNHELKTIFWKQQYIHNVFVHNSNIENNFYCNEENKLIYETQKIFNYPIPISPTCIRVPVLRSHCESINIQFNNDISYDKIIDFINNENTLQLIDDKNSHLFPTSISSNNSHLVQVGHIRHDTTIDGYKGWNFWISSDQILRGAAYNAYLIMIKIINY